MMAVNLERESLLASRGVDHDRAAVLAQLDNVRPHQISHARRNHTHEDTGAHLEQPSGEVASQPDWACREDEDYHGNSSSPYPVPPATLRSAPSQR